jgi:hypothetical protein
MTHVDDEFPSPTSAFPPGTDDSLPISDPPRSPHDEGTSIFALPGSVFRANVLKFIRQHNKNWPLME